MYQYKAERVGKHFVRIDRFFPSSKRCSCCGFKLPELKLAVREWTCPKCGVPHDRDFNACLNIKQEGIRILKASGLTVLRSSRHEPKPLETCKTQTRVRAVLPDLFSNRAGSSHRFTSLAVRLKLGRL
ncbi:MAG: zinc ribbon domain-containing protein [Sutterellaceae bacterium]|nr:zinc ribbon domain-containing protein [Sutterellaceae bacterium]